MSITFTISASTSSTTTTRNINFYVRITYKTNTISV